MTWRIAGFLLLLTILVFIVIRGWLRVRRIDREMAHKAAQHDEHFDMWNHQ